MTFETIPVLSCWSCDRPLSPQHIAARETHCEHCANLPPRRVEQVQMADKGGKVRAVLVRVAV